MTKYNVGDKVRILDASRILGLQAETGAVLDVVSLDAFGDPRVLDVNDKPLCFYSEELRYIEKVSDKPTKNQRITTLESQVAELQAEVATLKKAQATPKFVPVTTDNIAVGDKIRVKDVRGISIATAIGFKNGIVATVVTVESGGIEVEDVVNGGIPLSIATHEFSAIEKVVSE